MTLALISKNQIYLPLSPGQCICMLIGWGQPSQRNFSGLGTVGSSVSYSSAGNYVSCLLNNAGILYFYNENTGLKLVFIFLIWSLLPDSASPLIITGKKNGVLIPALCQHWLTLYAGEILWGFTERSCWVFLNELLKHPEGCPGAHDLSW